MTLSAFTFGVFAALLLFNLLLISSASDPRKISGRLKLPTGNSRILQDMWCSVTRARLPYIIVATSQMDRRHPENNEPRLLGSLLYCVSWCITVSPLENPLFSSFLSMKEFQCSTSLCGFFSTCHICMQSMPLTIYTLSPSTPTQHRTPPRDIGSGPRFFINDIHIFKQHLQHAKTHSFFDFCWHYRRFTHKSCYSRNTRPTYSWQASLHPSALYTTKNLNHAVKQGCLFWEGPIYKILIARPCV